MIVVYKEDWTNHGIVFKIEVWELFKGEWLEDRYNIIQSYWIVPGTVDPMED